MDRRVHVVFTCEFLKTAIIPRGTTGCGNKTTTSRCLRKFCELNSMEPVIPVIKNECNCIDYNHEFKCNSTRKSDLSEKIKVKKKRGNNHMSSAKLSIEIWVTEFAVLIIIILDRGKIVNQGWSFHKATVTLLTSIQGICFSRSSSL